MTDSGSDELSDYNNLISYLKIEINRLYKKMDNLCDNNDQAHKDLRDEFSRSFREISTKIDNLQNNYNNLAQRVAENERKIDSHLNEHQNKLEYTNQLKLSYIDNETKKFIAFVTVTISTIVFAVDLVVELFVIN